MRADIRLRAVGPPVRVGALPFSFVFVFFAFLVPSKIVRRTAEPTSHRFLIKMVFFFKKYARISCARGVFVFVP